MKSLEEKYAEILEENGIKDEIKCVVLRPSGLAGEHFASVTELATIEFKDGGMEPLNLFVKRILPCANSAELDSAEKLMIKEGSFLTTILTDMCQGYTNQPRACGALRNIFPRTYRAGKEEIIMEDLGSRGLKVLNKMEKHDLPTAQLVFENLAIFHAFSYCWVKNSGGKEIVIQKYPFLNEIYDSVDIRIQTQESCEPSFTTLLNILAESPHAEARGAYDKISSYRGKFMETLLEAIYRPDHLFDVLGHGDLWNNNMLFSPSKGTVVFIDFQVLRINSPCLDIAHYLFINTGSNVRRQWKELLKIYWEKLTETIRVLGEEFQWTFDQLVEDFRATAPMGLLFGLFMTIGMEAMGGYAVSETDGFDSAKFTDTIKKWVSNNPEKVKRVVDQACALILDAAQIF